MHKFCNAFLFISLYVEVLEELLRQIQHQREPATWRCLPAQLVFTYLSADRLCSVLH